MANGAGPTGPTKQQQRIRIDLNELPTAGCPNCGCSIFVTNVALFKKLSALRSPTGKPMLAEIKLALCQECGAVAQPVGDELQLLEIVPKDGEADNDD